MFAPPAVAGGTPCCAAAHSAAVPSRTFTGVTVPSAPICDTDDVPSAFTVPVIMIPFPGEGVRPAGNETDEDPASTTASPETTVAPPGNPAPPEPVTCRLGSEPGASGVRGST